MQEQKIVPHSDLIYDIGVNHGEDSRFYLDKGFRVVGVEANPILADKIRELFSDEIGSGQYTLIASGLWSEEASLAFYRNLDNDHWSSFDPAYGCRDGTKFETVLIPCTTIAALIKQFGVPYFLKIDVEGADRFILRGLSESSLRPAFISVEEYGLQSIHDLHEIGYDEFQILPQMNKSWCRLPQPALEGRYTSRVFADKDSGTFGRELPERWLRYTDVLAEFQTKVRRADFSYVGPRGEWYDIHARCTDGRS